MKKKIYIYLYKLCRKVFKWHLNEISKCTLYFLEMCIIRFTGLFVAQSEKIV